MRVFRRILRVISGVGGFLILAFAFLRWETDIASIPGSLSEQLAFVREMPGGTVPIIVYSVIGIALVLLAIGPHRVHAWIKWASPGQPSPTTVTPVSEAGPSSAATGETHRDPLQVEEETDEEFLIRRCIEVEQELTTFWQRHQYSDPDEFVVAFKKRQERKVNGLRQRMDGQGWLTAQERDALTLRPGDGPEKVEQIIYTLRKIAEGG